MLGTPLLQPPGAPTKLGFDPHVIPADCPGSVLPTWVAQISTALLDVGGAGISDVAPPPLDELVDELLAPELELELDAPLLDEDDELLELDEELVDPLEDVEPLEEPEVPDEEPELLAGALPSPEPPPHPARKAARTSAPARDTLEELPHIGRIAPTLIRSPSATPEGTEFGISLILSANIFFASL